LEVAAHAMMRLVKSQKSSIPPPSEYMHIHLIKIAAPRQSYSIQIPPPAAQNLCGSPCFALLEVLLLQMIPWDSTI
jgi:hypothetical protein